MNESHGSRGRDFYRSITDDIVKAIEAGAPAFEMPWHQGGGRPINAYTDTAYRGVNVVGLWARAGAAGYESRYWATYKQWRMLDAQVRAGAHGSPIVFYKEVERALDEAEEEEGTAPAPQLVARFSFVFNVEQVDGWQPSNPARDCKVMELAEAEAFVANTRADIRHGGDTACYYPTDDYIRMPNREHFVGTLTASATECYYSTLLHELTHWTGHRSRIDRNLVGRFGDQAYAMEELIAELGAAFLCADLRISPSPRLDHAAYIAHWLEVLKRDKKAVFSASSKAANAADFLDRLQRPASFLGEVSGGQ